jgi:hypothetical protein
MSDQTVTGIVNEVEITSYADGNAETRFRLRDHNAWFCANCSLPLRVNDQVYVKVTKGKITSLGCFHEREDIKIVYFSYKRM